MDKQLDRPDIFPQKAETQANYNPQFNSVETRLVRGMQEMAKTISRDLLPQGRPLEAPNLIELPQDYSSSIDPERVKQGLSKLGHT